MHLYLYLKNKQVEQHCKTKKLKFLIIIQYKCYAKIY